MNLIVNKSAKLQGRVVIPGSKSQSVRALLFSLLAKGTSTLFNILDSEDTKATLNVCNNLGAQIVTYENKMIITSNGLPLLSDSLMINTSNSGITTLFALSILGLRENYDIPVVLDCGEQMRERPIKPLIDALQQLGMNITSLDRPNKLPVVVTGQLQGGTIEIEGFNSQYLSALLISLPCAKKNSVINVHHLHERPYVDMTLAFLNQQKIKYEHQKKGNVDKFVIQGNQYYTACDKTISGDFSSASCLIAAATFLGGEVELQGLNFNDTQGDKKIINLLQEMGAEISIESHAIKIVGGHPLKGIEIDASDIPDLLPVLAVIGTQAVGQTRIYNVPHARIKETDRIRSMTEGLRKMGAQVDEHEDGMTIYQSQLKGTLVNGYNDHRTVMALAVAGMLAEGATIITQGEAINKTYPAFVQTLRSLKANIHFNIASTDKHIVLIGFKNVGKTRIGNQLATLLQKDFVDLDKEIEKLYQDKNMIFLNCRQIMEMHGEAFFRELEAQALEYVLKKKSCVISLGGGTVLDETNQKIIQDQLLIHVQAPRGIVFERIMVEGRPAFFDPKSDPYETFSRLWDERMKIYQQLTALTVENNGTIEQAVCSAIMNISSIE